MPFNKLLFLLLLNAQLLWATNGPLQLHRIEGEIILNGIPDEPAWQDIEPLPLVQHLPTFGKAPTEKSVVRIAYNDEFLYLSAIMYDSEPDKIQSSTKKRDAMVANTDWLGIILDSYNDKENALAFFTTPAGIRSDASVFNDAIGTLPINSSWNTFWDVEAQAFDEGWQVEIRIPFTSLNFQDIDGKVTMGMTVWRYISRKNEALIFPAIPPNWGQWSSWKPSVFQEVSFEGVKRKRPVYIAPYLLGGFRNNSVLNTGETAYETEKDWDLEPGLDVKLGITNNLTLDLSVNTDFAQVEADDEQVNLTRFNLFFPEKRLFFQERSGIFDFSFGRVDKLFYSRRIGIEDGQPVRIWGGARLVGRVGAWDMGLINMQTASTDSIKGENFSVLRLRKNVFNPNSYVGALFLNRMDWDGNYLSTYGLDGNIRVGDDTFLGIKWAQSFEDGKENNPLSLDPTKFFVSIVSRNSYKFNYATSFSRSGKDFNPNMGFQLRDNYTRIGSRLGYGWEMKEASTMVRNAILYRGTIHFNNEHQKFETYEGTLNWEFLWKNGLQGEIGFGYDIEHLFSPFELSDEVDVPLGNYDFLTFEGMFFTPPTAPIYMITQFKIGQYYDGSIGSIGLSPFYNISSSLELSGTYQFNKVKFEDRNQEFIAHILRLKVLYMLNTKLSVSSFVQFNSADHLIIGNFRLRYNPREGNDFYIVFNENRNSDRQREMPFLPASQSRTFLLKYTYTFRL